MGPVQAGGIIVWRDRVVLRRTLLGEWVFPKGWIDPGESLEQTALREVREETGLETEIVELVEVFERILRDQDLRVQYHFVLIDYLCRVIAGEAKAASDVSEVRWTKLEDLESLEVAPQTCEVIRKALRIR